MVNKMIGVLTVLAGIAGCRAVQEARMAQVASASRGCAATESAERIELRDYSLEELVGFAMTNRPSVVSAALAVEDARLAVKEILADAPLFGDKPWLAPHLAFTGGYSAASVHGADNGPELRTEGNASAGLSLQILLYDFGRSRARVDAQVERLIAAEFDFIREGYSVFEEVSSAYFNLLARDALLQVAETNELEYALHLEQSEARFKSGEAQQLDVTRARLDLSRAREATIAASNQVVTTGAELMRALGVDAAHGTRNEVWPSAGVSLSEMTRGFANTSYDVVSAFEFARTNAPVMAVARAKLRAADCNVDYAVADLMPSVSASVGLNWVDPLWAWSWGVNVVQSIFQGFRKTTAVDRAVVALQTASAAVDEAEQRLSLEIETAIAARDNAAKAYETARVSVASAKENLDMVKARYAEGDASRVDFTDSVSAYATALGNRISAFYQGQLAESRLFALLGKLPEFLEDTVTEND